MDLSDEQLVLMTWEVAVRKGWGFVVDTLLRGGVEVFPPAFDPGRGQGFWNKFGDWSQQDLVPADNPMVSQESGDEEEEMTVMDTFSLNSMEWPSCSGQCPRCCAHTSREEPSVRSANRKDQGETFAYLKIKQFIDEVTRVFHDYFPGIEMPGGKPALTACESSHPVSICGKPGLSTGILAKRSYEDAATQIPMRDVSCVPVEQLSTDAISGASPQAQEVALVRIMALLPSVAVTKSVPQAPAGVAEDFHWAQPLGAYVPIQLREAVVSLRFFDMFSLLQGQSTGHHGQKEDVIDRTLLNWQRAFEVMGSILLEDAPEKMTGFFNYSVTIRRVHDQLPEGAWHIYDQLFRKLKEAHPDTSWAVVHPQLWQQVSKPVQHPHEEKAIGKTCQLYDEDKCKQADLCHFAHLCSKCGGKHPKMKCSLLKFDMHSKPTNKQHTGVEVVLKRDHGQHPSGEFTTGDLYGKDTKPEEQKQSIKTPLRRATCRHYLKGYCRFGDDCVFRHFCSKCGDKHSRLNCSKSNPMPQKRKPKEKFQQPDEEAVKSKKYCERQQDKLVMGDFNFGLLCAKCGGNHQSGKCTIVNPDAEVQKQENKKHPSRGPVVKEICIWYNKEECEVGEICRYRHVCSSCGDNHPLVKCIKLRPTSEKSNPKKRKKRARRKSKVSTCGQFNIGNCKFGKLCLFKHLCSKCHGTHSEVTCRNKTPI